MSGAAAPTVAICIATRRRPDGLFALLGALDAQCFEGAIPEIRVVVVDNDDTASARSICEEARTWLRWSLTYVHEKRQGIPMARNACVAAAWSADWIAFIDDDEIPEPGWLEALLRSQRVRSADVVAGPVVPRFRVDPPAWIVAGRFHEHEGYAVGARSARTGNLLVRTASLARLSALFDERMTPLGEDRELFERLTAAGGHIVWAADAIVVEEVPPERSTLRWVLQRGFRVGVASTRIAWIRRSRWRAAPRVLAHGLWCVLRGLLEASLAPLRGAARGAAGLRLAAFGLGRWAGLAAGPRIGVPERNQGPGVASA
jgi:cellulose synthase/poly-beta-1,6-N-acetylglucosamine synthase-like glycosyltransferase